MADANIGMRIDFDTTDLIEAMEELQGALELAGVPFEGTVLRVVERWLTRQVRLSPASKNGDDIRRDARLAERTVAAEERIKELEARLPPRVRRVSHE